MSQAEYHHVGGGHANGTPATTFGMGSGLSAKAFGKRKAVDVHLADCVGPDPPKAHSHHKEPCHMGASNRGWDASLKLAARLQAEDDAASDQQGITPGFTEANHDAQDTDLFNLSPRDFKSEHSHTNALYDNGFWSSGPNALVREAGPVDQTECVMELRCDEEMDDVHCVEVTQALQAAGAAEP